MATRRWRWRWRRRSASSRRSRESGTPAQRRAYLAAFAGRRAAFRGDRPYRRRLAAAAQASATRAQRDGAGWRLDGAKALVPLASALRRSSSSPPRRTKARAPSSFRPPRPACSVAKPQRVAGPARAADGRRRAGAASTSRGGAAARRPAALLDLSRVALSAILSGLARGRLRIRAALHEAARRARRGDRAQAIGRVQARRHACRRSGDALDDAARGLRARRGADRDPQRRLARRYAAEHGLKIADEGVQLFGGHGYMRDLPLEMWYRNARSLSVLDGLVGV